MANGPENFGEVLAKSLAAGVGAAAQNLPRERDKQRQQLLQNFEVAMQMREARERSILNRLTRTMRQMQVQEANLKLKQAQRQATLSPKQLAEESAEAEVAGLLARSAALQAGMTAPENVELLPTGELSFTPEVAGQRAGAQQRAYLEEVLQAPLGESGLQPEVSATGKVTFKQPGAADGGKTLSAKDQQHRDYIFNTFTPDVAEQEWNNYIANDDPVEKARTGYRQFLGFESATFVGERNIRPDQVVRAATTHGWSPEINNTLFGVKRALSRQFKADEIDKDTYQSRLQQAKDYFANLAVNTERWARANYKNRGKADNGED